jgi:hypothetical protein
MIGEDMDGSVALEGRRQELLVEMGGISSMRIGSLNDLHVKVRLASGEQAVRGPYKVLTYKGPDGKTKSESIKPEDIERVQAEVENHKRFKELSAEYAKTCDLLSKATDLPTERAKKN